MPVIRRAKPDALGVHIYAGGFTLGVMKHFNVLAHLEEWQFGVQTVRDNIGIPVHVGEFGQGWPVSDFKDVPLVYGNPPCAAWSHAGVKITTREKDEEKKAAMNVRRYEHDLRVACTNLLFETAKKIRPRFFVWESVAAAFKNGRPFVDEKAKMMNRLGYAVTLLLFDGCDIGTLAQHRRRFFFVAHKTGFEIAKPECERRMTVRDAWDGRDQVPGPCANMSAEKKAQWRVMLKKTLNKRCSLATCWERLHDFNVPRGPNGFKIGKPAFIMRRCSYDLPAPTITGSACLIHPTESRPLTVKEQQLLCGYPEDYEFAGNVSGQYAQIAKAVLPPVGEWLAKNIARSMRELTRPVAPTTRVVDYLSGSKTSKASDAA